MEKVKKCINCKKRKCLPEMARGRKFIRAICNTCKSRKWINENPVRYAWHMLKHSARKRHLEFTLTFEYFEMFIMNTGYMNNRGRLFNNLTIDRIDGSRGYTNDNIQAITKSQNSKKYHSEEKDLPF